MEIIYENKIRPLLLEPAGDLSSVPHFQKEIEMIYVKDGSSVAHADHNCFLLHGGDLFIAFPNQIHYYENTAAGHYYLIICMPELLYNLESSVNGHVPVSNQLHLGTGSAEELLLVQAASAFRDGRLTECCGYMNLFAGRIFPRLALKQNIAPENLTVRSILDYCAHSSAGKITLDTAAESLHLSKYYISHLMNQKLHLSFNDYVNNLRVNSAADLLKNSDKKIADISEDVGFGTIRSFNRAFLRAMHMTPKEYRELLNADQSSEFK